MNDIEKLEERIAQLTELVNTGTETLESLKETLKTVEKERDRLAEKQKPKFERVNEGKKYYYIDFGQYRGKSCSFVQTEIEEGRPIDEALYNANNYYHTKQRAQEVADKFNFLMKLERLHDTFCPDYVPNWDDENEYKYTVYYDSKDKCYGINKFCIIEYKPDVVFPTSKIAQKVCDILNEELKEDI